MNKRAKVYAAFMALAIPSFAGLFAMVYVSHGIDRQRALDLMESYAESVGNGLSVFFADAAAVASSAASLTSVRSLDWSEAGEDFSGMIRSNRFIHRMSLVDSRGYVYDAYESGVGGNPAQGGRRTADNRQPDAEPINVSGEELFRALVADNPQGERRVALSPSFVPKGLSEKVIVTSSSVIQGGRAVGAVNVAQSILDLSNLCEDLALDFEKKFGREAHLYLVCEGGAQGQVVADIAFNERYGAYMDRLFGANEVVYGSQLDESLISALGAAAESPAPVISARVEGTERFVSDFIIPSSKFAVFLTMPANSLLNSFNRLTGILTDIFMFLVAGTAALLFYVRRIMDNGEGDSRKPRKERSPRRWGFGGDIHGPILPPGIR